MRPRILRNLAPDQSEQFEFNFNINISNSTFVNTSQRVIFLICDSTFVVITVDIIRIKIYIGLPVYPYEKLTLNPHAANM